MPFVPLPEGTNLYIPTTLVIVAYILYAIFGMRVKQNYFFRNQPLHSYHLSNCCLYTIRNFWDESKAKLFFLELEVLNHLVTLKYGRKQIRNLLF